ncbi:MAG: hypothetical protein IK020_13485 [Clostridiales bacterium]|nr:hypothetical protein [Clostridiales bacterium]
MTDFDITIKGAGRINVYGTKDNTVVLPVTAKIDTARRKFDVAVEGEAEVTIGIPEKAGKIELACADASICLSNLCFEELEIDGKGHLKIDASDIAGSLEINLIGGEAELAVPADFSFRTKNKGHGCTIESEIAETSGASNIVELNGKDSKLTVCAKA